MHQKFEFGVPSHWRYKEGEATHSSFIIQMVECVRWVITWSTEIMDIELCFISQDVHMRTPCTFPSHKYGCPHMDKLCNPPCGINDSLHAIMLEDDKLNMTFLEKPYYDALSLIYSSFKIHLLIFYIIFYVCCLKFLP